jgi:hypothetical protein
MSRLALRMFAALIAVPALGSPAQRQTMDQRGLAPLRATGAFGIVSSSPHAVPQSAGSGKAGTGAVRRSTRQRRIQRCHVLVSAMETVCDARRSLQS